MTPDEYELTESEAKVVRLAERAKAAAAKAKTTAQLASVRAKQAAAEALAADAELRAIKALRLARRQELEMAQLREELAALKAERAAQVEPELVEQLEQAEPHTTDDAAPAEQDAADHQPASAGVKRKRASKPPPGLSLSDFRAVANGGSLPQRPADAANGYAVAAQLAKSIQATSADPVRT